MSNQVERRGKLILIVITLIAVFLGFSTYRKTSYMEGTNGVEHVRHCCVNLNGSKPMNNSRLMEKSTSKQVDEWEVIGSWPYGACNTVIADSNYVYIGTGGVIIIADMTDPSAPIEISRIVTPGAVWKLFRSGNYLYVANKMAGLRVIDVSDPLNPVEVGSFEKQHWGWENARDVYVYGSYAYVALGGLYILDVSNPSNPVEVTHYTSDWIWDVYVSDNYAYMTTSSYGLLILDVSDPENPVEISSCLDLECESRVYVSDGYAYVAGTHKGFYIINVNNPSNPVVVAHLHTTQDWVWDVHGSGNYVYMVSHDSGLHILDVSNPSNPREVGSYHYLSSDWEDIYVYGNYVYNTFSDGGLRVIDVSDPSNPMKVCFFKTSGTALDVFVSGRYAYVANNDFHVLDIIDPSNPKEVGGKFSIGKDAWNVHVSGDYAYISGTGDDDKPCLRIFNIRDASNPIEVGSYSTHLGGAVSSGLFISGNYAYLLGYYTGLHIIDVSDPSNPVEISSFDASGPGGVYVSGNYAYVTYGYIDRPDYYLGLRILDVSNPSNPVEVSSINTPGDGSGVYVSSGYAYMAAGDSRLHIIDVNDPSNPIEVASFYKSAGNIQDIYVSGDYAYVACVPFGLIILDVSNPSNPIEVASVNKMEAWGVYVYCGYIYVVDMDFGVIIIKNINNIFHTLNLASGLGGKTDPDPGNYTHDCGTEITVTAIPDPRYRFINWTGDFPSGKKNNNPITIIMDSDKSVEANFTVLAPPMISLNRSAIVFGSIINCQNTDSQSFIISNSGGGSLNWSLLDNQNWLSCTPISGTNSGTIIVSVDPSGLSAGTYTGTISISDPNASNSPQKVSVTLNVYLPELTSAPFGSFDTPGDESTVRSSIPVTGWVLDDIGVEGVKIYRREGNNLVFIGDAVFVEGARPDVEQAYPGYPKNYQAGWGYMMLTNFLPDNGNGTFKIHAIAADIEGNQVTLGIKTITCDNANAVKPFGAIDTPAQGGLAAGSNYRNQGWVLTPMPNSIPIDGSTINVIVDGFYIGHPTYNVYRQDIAALFPGYANSNGALAYFDLDTTTYSNGVHTISWNVTDDAGNTDGIGSRYFSIQNTGSQASSGARELNVTRFKYLKEFPLDYSLPIGVKKGYRKNAETVELFSNENENTNITIKELGRVELHIANLFAGYMKVGNQFNSLPIGSTLDTQRDIFYWQPGPGFMGKYHLVFILEDQDGNMIRKNVIVNIVSKFSKQD